MVLPSLHSQRLKRRISRVGVETGLKLGEQFSGDGRDVADAGHGEQDAFGTGIKRQKGQGSIVLLAAAIDACPYSPPNQNDTARSSLEAIHEIPHPLGRPTD